LRQIRPIGLILVATRRQELVEEGEMAPLGLQMLAWAGLIVALTAFSVAMAFVGLAVIFPVLGYVSWHSYRALVK
jgi:hypothetical protein